MSEIEWETYTAKDDGEQYAYGLLQCIGDAEMLDRVYYCEVVPLTLHNESVTNSNFYLLGELYKKIRKHNESFFL